MRICFLTLILAFALNSCVTIDPNQFIRVENGGQPTPTPQPQPQGGGARQWNDKGYALGQDDGMSEKSENWRRHASVLTDDRYRAEFSDGYARGYQAGVSEAMRQNNRDIALAALFNEGHYAGSTDRRKGLSAKPERHSFEDNKYGTWKQGYDDGYAGRPRQ